jgi:methylmalonyl-CoA mutase N-terminal domain/subunit
MGKIDEMGGAVKAIEEGFMQEAIADEAYRAMRQEKSGERVVVGVNKFTAEDEEKEKREMRFHEADPLVRQRQIDRLNQVRNERDENAVRDCLNELKEKARGKENVMPCLIKTVRTYASIEEIMEALKEVFGTFKEPLRI